jgi:EpsI family protein
MRLAVGVDHLIYGWIFYALVMCLLLWVGSLFSDERAPEEPKAPAEPAEVRPPPLYRMVFLACAAVLSAAVWPVWAGYAESSGVVSSIVSFVFPERLGAWTHGGERPAWEPHYVGASFEGGAVYESGDTRVGLHVALYPDERQGAELVSSANSLVPPEVDLWRQRSLEGREVSLRTGRLAVEEAILAGPNGELLVWRWYWVAGHPTSSAVWAKVIEASEKLRFRRPLAAGVVAFTQMNDVESARARLEALLAEAVPAIESNLGKLSP